MHVVCSQGPYALTGPITAPARQEALVRVHRLGATGFGRNRLPGRIADYASFHVLALAKVLALPRMDVCVALTTPPFICLVGVMLSRLRGTRLVLWCMDLYPEVAVAYGVLRRGSLLERVFAGISRLVYASAERIVSLGEFMTARLIAAGASAHRTVTVHNWVPGECVRCLPPGRSHARERYCKGSQVMLMYSGNLGVGHDLETAIQAMHRLRDDPDLRLHFVGAGKRLSALRALAVQLRLDSVEFHPPFALEQLSDNLAAADVHLVSQRPLTQGLIVPSKVYGILAAGRPFLFVGPDNCEAATIARQSGAGVVVPPGDADSLSDAIRRLADNAALRREMGDNARRYYEAHLGRDRSLQAMLQAIEHAGAKRAP